ncbi:MAG: hypothetical protein R2703_16230 [Micropruina glycogenica]
MTYRVEALSDATFPAFEALVRKHNGIFGGCWCLWFHEQGGTGSHEGNCAAKKRLVEQGIAHHALDTKKMSASFLFNGTLHMFERAGFERVADLAKFRCIVRRTVAQAH